MERQALVRLAQTRMQRDMVAEGLRSLKREMQMASLGWQELRGKSCAVEELLWMRNRWRWLFSEARSQENLLQEWEERVGKVQEEWMEAKKARETMDRLKHRAFEEFIASVRRAETQALDEAALRPHVSGPAGAAGILGRAPGEEKGG